MLTTHCRHTHTVSVVLYTCSLDWTFPKGRNARLSSDVLAAQKEAARRTAEMEHLKAQLEVCCWGEKVGGTALLGQDKKVEGTINAAIGGYNS